MCNVHQCKSNAFIGVLNPQTKTVLYTLYVFQEVKVYNFLIKCKTFFHINNFPYVFKVRGVHNSMKLIDEYSQNEVKNQLNNTYSYCDFVITNNNLERNDKILIYIQINDTQSSKVIYAKSVNYKEYLQILTKGETNLLLLSGKEGVIDSSSQLNKKYLYLDNINPKEFLLVSVYSRYKTSISLFKSTKYKLPYLHISYYNPRVIFYPQITNTQIILPQGTHAYLSLEAFGNFEGPITNKDNTVIENITLNDTILYFNYHNLTNFD